MKQRVFVYYNLHTNLWSVRSMSGETKGKVIAHARELMVSEAKGRVQQAGRLRVLRERVKNVHAGIVGDLVYIKPESTFYGFSGGSMGVRKEFFDHITSDVVTESHGIEYHSKALTYNPYRDTTFVHKDDRSEFGGSNFVSMSLTDERKPIVTSHYIGE